MSRKLIISVGTTFNDWTILKEVESTKGSRVFLCKCKCGKEKLVTLGHLRNGHSTKCRSCHIAQQRYKHGDYESRLYRIWCTLKQRPKRQQGYKNVEICEEWLNYIPFKNWALTNGYTDNLSIDRIDGTKGYYPENCRWTTAQVQAENTKLLSSHNTSGYRNVSWNKAVKKWASKIKVCNKRIFLGYFTTKEDAALAYDKYVLEHNLIHRPLNILKR